MQPSALPPDHHRSYHREGERCPKDTKTRSSLVPLPSRFVKKHEGYCETDLANVNYGQMTRKTPELALPNFSTTPTEESLTHDVTRPTYTADLLWNWG
ncbi:hypothetical protein AVEN_258948-1 [Araneus ventricosus]|uniref:Uncharacterized protein n=1 Tax=Araneus ventricosus TaxID=182803 RepID=A0A4Y2CFJ8_ARAVE|nr:hypothetical protein AVEN_258948-1 [Araneus ventricosus]